MADNNTNANNANSVNNNDAADALRSSAGGSPAPARRSLSQLNAAGKKTTTAKSKEKSEWVMELTPAAQTSALRWLSAKAVLGPIKAREENSKSEFCEYGVRKVAEQIFATKGKVTNPKVYFRKADNTLDHHFTFVFQDRFKLSLPAPKNDQDHRELLIQTFTDAGLHPTSAAQLVDSELDISPSTNLRSPKELMEGHYGENRMFVPATAAEQAVGQKLLDLVLWDGHGTAPTPLTDDERSLVIVTADSVKVKSGFLDRVATYCQSVDQLMAIFSLITPVAYPGYDKFAESDSDEERLNRKVEACREIIGS